MSRRSSAGSRGRSSALTVRFVDGEKTRQKHVEFALGGHDRVYTWVPRNTVVLERMRSRASYRFTFAHEMIELLLMQRLGYPYQKAHDIANRLEGELRHGAPVGRTFERYLARYCPRHRREDRATVRSVVDVFRRLK